ncbi:MAG: bifunctional serine/threonine-protein kinase/formylglycine-generating enzyme family protein [Verrucomicrobiota bacterium]
MKVESQGGRASGTGRGRGSARPTGTATGRTTGSAVTGVNLVARDRSAPQIPDHEVIRCIGRGAYGEVWMARSVTDVLRAVKVVWREDYDSEAMFERELEGLTRFEPISRRHVGLVDILQVGVNEDAGFYYYIMELADDVESGRDIDPDDYVPHTLSAQMARRTEIDLEKCLEDGAVLADGLWHMHEHDLIHRDVKPSNVIYVDGEAKLADIGLVALTGQRSFVGTEGFVPPEGPGTPAADIYSLGMVLYEMGTGKDRLDFPDVPTTTTTNAKQVELWRRLNKVICRAGAVEATERFRSARDMSLALQGQAVAESRNYVPWVLGAAALVAAGVYVWAEFGRGEVVESGAETGSPGTLMVMTDPEGVEIWEVDGTNPLGVTPFEINRAPGSRVSLVFRKEGYRPVERGYLFTEEGSAPMEVVMEEWTQPLPGERWRNGLAMEFLPQTDGHISKMPVSWNEFYQFLDATGRTFEGEVRTIGEEQMHSVVIVPFYDAEEFAEWLEDIDRAKGFLSSDHSYGVRQYRFGEGDGEGDGEDEAPVEVEAGEAPELSGEIAFQCVVERQRYGSVFIESTPEGAEIYQRGTFIGTTPKRFPMVKSGLVQYELRMEGFEPVIVQGDVMPNEELPFYKNLRETEAVSFDREWSNSLGMKFVPMGDVMFGAWETRVGDYKKYLDARKLKPRQSVAWTQKPTQPVVEVNREEALAFCEWLTAEERKRDLIRDDQYYRLPTDLEWSKAVGLPPERGLDPAARNGGIKGMYPWGFQWPPPAKTANFADGSAKAALKNKVIKGYTDGMRFTGEVTGGEGNDQGIMHLAGNVWEWVGDDYGGTDDKKARQGVLRGGSWRSVTPGELWSSNRKVVSPNSRLDDVGFRVVLALEDPFETAER